MKKIFFVLLILSLFITACTGGKNETNTKTGEAYTGTSGVELFLDQAEPILVFPGEKLTFPVRVVNMGRFDTDVVLSVSGYDPSLMEYSKKQQIVTPLEGKKSAGLQAIPGQEEVVYFDSTPVKIVGTSLSQNTVVTACYLYQTELTYGVCVDRNANSKCDMTAPKNAELAAGQGAPVAITSITSLARGPSSGKTRVTFAIAFTQVDTTNNAKIVRRDKVDSPCNGEKLDLRQDFDSITIDEIRLGNELKLNCPAVSDGRPLNLKYTNTLTCYAEIPYENADYNSGLYIKASYGMLTSVTQPITIEADETMAGSSGANSDYIET
jgi:hypothetical protein